ncbi:MAG: hypothetical protein KAR19_10515 [Bacteroidales bacterium]|nr:hypothetical protein [Bacteroidales bacterium]
MKFRRQYLFTTKKCPSLGNWQYEELGSHKLYVHPDCDLTIVRKGDFDFALVGYTINPRFPDQSNTDVLNDISSIKSISEIPVKLYGLVGRFVLFIKQEDQCYIFHDTCGLRQVVYTKYENAIHAASQPLLLELVMELIKGTKYHEYFNSVYANSNIEHHIPSGTSLYDHVDHLVPNHYLDASNNRQIRFWPTKPLKTRNLEETVDQYCNIVKNTLRAANNRFKLALPLTAGVDSRTILSSCKDLANDVYFYTLKYYDLTDKSPDIRIPLNLMSQLDYPHYIIDCRRPIDERFAEIYNGNTDNPHLHDWGIIAHAMYEDYPQERVTLKGNCAEIARCQYYPSGKHPEIKSGTYVLNLTYNWKHIDFIKDRMMEWFDDIEISVIPFGYKPLDIYYWEQRLGSWQAQSQLEWDIVQEAFTPFNNRELLDMVLGVDPKYRCYPDYLFYRKAMQAMWTDVLEEPINPKSLSRKFKKFTRKTLVKAGFINPMDPIKFRLR